MKRKNISLVMLTVLLLFCSACQSATSSKEGVTSTPTVTTVPTKEVTPTNTVTKEPEQKESSIANTMTVENYPRVDGSTATLPLSQAVFMLATGENEQVAT